MQIEGDLRHKQHKHLNKKKDTFSNNLGKCTHWILEDVKKLLYLLKVKIIP